MAEQLNDEIEQFLKRSQQRRATPEHQRRAAPEQQRSAQSARSQAPPPPRPSLAEQALDVLPVDDAPESVAESVSRHLGEGIANRSSQLAADVTRSQAEMQEHLQKAFQRRVGTFADEPRDALQVEASGEAESTPAAELAALLRTPQGARQAIVLAEILKPPSQRW